MGHMGGLYKCPSPQPIGSTLHVLSVNSLLITNCLCDRGQVPTRQVNQHMRRATLIRIVDASQTLLNIDLVKSLKLSYAALNMHNSVLAILQ